MSTWPSLSLCVPFYLNGGMLRRQIQEWERYPDTVRIILVDDGSPEPAAPIVEAHASHALRQRLSVYRILQDVAWNRGGARNLATFMSETDWIVHIDVDHVLPASCALALTQFHVEPSKWYRFPRFRRGKADETRMKDQLPRDQEYGPILPHMDSYLVPRQMFWDAGGYNESFSGCLGGGSPFIAELTKLCAPELLPSDVHLEVFTRSEVADASDFTLSRDTSEFTRRKREMAGDFRGKPPYLRFDWRREL